MVAKVKNTAVREGFDKNGKRIHGTRSQGPPAAAAAAAASSTKSKRKIPSSKKKTPGKPPRPTMEKALAASKKAVLEEAQAKAEGKPAPKKEEKKRFWKPVEDKCLCQAYVSVSGDPTVGNNQTAEQFWTRVMEKCDSFIAKEIEDPKPWSWDSIRSRFQKTISKSTMVYLKYYKEVHKEDKSGWTTEMYLDQACKLHKEVENKVFKHRVCARILMALPKFNPDTVPEDAEDQDPFVDDNGGGKPPANPIGSVMGGAVPRPVGCKKAKAIKKATDAATVASTAQASAVLSLGRASDNIAITLERNRKIEGIMNRAKLHVKMGNHQKATELMEEAEMLEASFAAATAKRVAARAINPSPLTVPAGVAVPAHMPASAMDHLRALENSTNVASPQKSQSSESTEDTNSTHASQPSDDSRKVKKQDT